MSADVLEGLSDGVLSLDDVERLYDSIMDSTSAGNVAEALGLSNTEWTAFAHGVWFDELARWRRRGWPTACDKCGRPILVDQFGWLAVARGDQHVLQHVTCP